MVGSACGHPCPQLNTALRGASATCTLLPLGSFGFRQGASRSKGTKLGSSNQDKPMPWPCIHLLFIHPWCVAIGRISLGESDQQPFPRELLSGSFLGRVLLLFLHLCHAKMSGTTGHLSSMFRYAGHEKDDKPVVVTPVLAGAVPAAKAACGHTPLDCPVLLRLCRCLDEEQPDAC